MRIIELCLSTSLGGLELYFSRCCQWFYQSNHHCIPLVLKESRLEKRMKEDGITFLTIGSRSKGLFLFNAYKLANVIENHNIDIVHIHDKKELTVAAFAKMICKKKFKLVHTRHMQLPHSKKDVWHKLLYSTIDLYITVTERLKSDAIARLPIHPDKIKKLNIGIKEPLALKKENCERFFQGHNSKSFKIGIFSRIEYLKGQHLVIEAAYLLHKTFPHLEYFFIGDSMHQEYTSKLKDSIQKYKLGDVIHFKGFYPSPMEIMPCFNLILMPSYNETFGLVSVEAMRCGVAVIGTNYGGVTEVIDHMDNGLLFKKDDSKDLKEKIELLIKNDDLRKELAQKGKLKADAFFNEEDHFNGLEKLFEEQL